jgi:acyl carrier protein
MIQASTQSTQTDAIEGWLARLLGEYAQKPVAVPLDPRLSLRDDLAIESLSLVSLVVRLGDKLGVDAADDSLDLAGLHTVGDLLTLAHHLQGGSHVTPGVGVGHTER